MEKNTLVNKHYIHILFLCLGKRKYFAHPQLPELTPKNRSYWRRLLCLSFSVFGYSEKKIPRCCFCYSTESNENEIDKKKNEKNYVEDLMMTYCLKIFSFTFGL